MGGGGAVQTVSHRALKDAISMSYVAVIMTCYNEGDYIGEAVRSVLDQSRADLIREIVIADDGSNAQTLEVLRDLETWDPRIRVIYGEGGTGLPGQRCRAIAETSADLLALLDGDDFWTSDRLEAQIDALTSDAAIGLVYSDFFGFPDGDISKARRAGVIDISLSPDLPRAYFLNDPPIIPSTILLRRSAYEASGGFDPAVKVFEDSDFFMRLANVTRFALVDKPLLFKRSRGASITGGRKDLLAHHAYVALKAAADNPALLSLVPRRLAERARKLANQRFLIGDLSEARRLSGFARQLRPQDPAMWAGYALARLPVPIVQMLRKHVFAKRVAALTQLETS
jgi:glycosyltransferase involved in cell wall biosynthesis